MALMLLHEQQKGQQSAVSGYVEQMPTDFDTLLHWSSEELQLLMYPHLIQQVCKASHRPLIGKLILSHAVNI